MNINIKLENRYFTHQTVDVSCFSVPGGGFVEFFARASSLIPPTIAISLVQI